MRMAHLFVPDTNPVVPNIVLHISLDAKAADMWSSLTRIPGLHKTTIICEYDTKHAQMKSFGPNTIHTRFQKCRKQTEFRFLS